MHVVYTDEEKRAASETDIVSILERNGQEVRRRGSEYEWLDNGQVVSIKDNLWYHQYEQVGGNTISFVKKFFKMDYPSALGFILGSGAGEISKSPVREKPKVVFDLPGKEPTMKRVFAYLTNTRGLDPEVVRFFVHNKLIYESAGNHNAVFVGTDKEGNARHAHLRSTGSESKWRLNQKGSDSRFSFGWRGTSDRIFVFEAPIDMISYISLHKENWQADNYISACSVSDHALMQRLQDDTSIRKVYVCLDNDGPGQEAASRIRDKLTEKGYEAEILIPELKDWNEDLLNSGQKEGEVVCQADFPCLSQ